LVGANEVEMDAANSKSVKQVVTPKRMLVGVGAIVVLLILALVATIYLTLLNNADAEEVLIDSVKTELIATSIAGREIIAGHIDLFKTINSQEDVDENWEEWVEVIDKLRLLNYEIGGEYIYALKEIDGEYFFIFDTDPEVEAAHDSFTAYELSDVHERAFAGQSIADVSNVVDAWGSFNTGAVPLFDEKGHQVGIVATDIADTFIVRHRETSAFYARILIMTTASIVVMMLIILSMLIRRNAIIQKHLFELANYDSISGLPNRNNLFSFLAREIDYLKDHDHVFAVYFIDLDNFKTVNDQAGHDTGDKLLQIIAIFLSNFAQKSDFSQDQGMEALTARIGGDEFLQLIPGVASFEQAADYAQSLLAAFSQDLSLQKYRERYEIGLSIGVALFPSMQTDYDELIKYADIAMYHAKNHGKSSYCIYDSTMGHDVEGAELTVRVNRGSR